MHFGWWKWRSVLERSPPLSHHQDYLIGYGCLSVWRTLHKFISAWSTKPLPNLNIGVDWDSTAFPDVKVDVCIYCRIGRSWSETIRLGLEIVSRRYIDTYHISGDFIWEGRSIVGSLWSVESVYQYSFIEWGRRRVIYLVHWVSLARLEASPKYQRRLVNVQCPRTLRSKQSFSKRLITAGDLFRPFHFIRPCYMSC